MFKPLTQPIPQLLQNMPSRNIQPPLYPHKPLISCIPIHILFPLEGYSFCNLIALSSTLFLYAWVALMRILHVMQHDVPPRTILGPSVISHKGYSTPPAPASVTPLMGAIETPLLAMGPAWPSRAGCMVIYGCSAKNGHGVAMQMTSLPAGIECSGVLTINACEVQLNTIVNINHCNVYIITPSGVRIYEMQ